MKIFRNKRQEHLKRSGLKDYLLYSIGEILLIVIGILLAVQLNNWNQARINSHNELEALKDLQIEFKLNESKIRAKQDLRIDLAPIIEAYIKTISSGNANANTFKEFHNSEFMFGMTNPSNGVIDALISSSDISLISNDSLKYHLAGWKNQLENLYENEQILWNSGIDFINCYSDQIPDTRYEWFDAQSKNIASNSMRILNNTNYRNKLVGFAGCNNIVIAECKHILSDIKNIRSLLNKEIRSKKQ